MAATQTKRSIDAFLECLTDDWKSTVEIASELGVTRNRVSQIVIAAAGSGAPVQRKSVLINNRWQHVFKRPQPGYVEPLYESRMDAWPIAQVWGGYTFKGATQCQV